MCHFSLYFFSCYSRIYTKSRTHLFRFQISTISIIWSWMKFSRSDKEWEKCLYVRMWMWIAMNLRFLFFHSTVTMSFGSAALLLSYSLAAAVCHIQNVQNAFSIVVNWCELKLNLYFLLFWIHWALILTIKLKKSIVCSLFFFYSFLHSFHLYTFLFIMFFSQFKRKKWKKSFFSANFLVIVTLCLSIIYNSWYSQAHTHQLNHNANNKV